MKKSVERMVGVAQLVRAPDCGSGSRRFESAHPPFGKARSGTRPFSHDDQQRDLSAKSKLCLAEGSFVTTILPKSFYVLESDPSPTFGGVGTR